MVTVVEVSLGDSARATGAFRYILTGHFKMHASGIRPFGLMNLEESTNLFQDQVERPGLVAGRRCDRIAMTAAPAQAPSSPWPTNPPVVRQ